ncbi:hypothetical protein ElP_40930 [Tautonia plasticadhaerens]|uniref:Uncharacterized protein n=1 Tax=Tautonia plasticadhaerens TaxID=2527974 RepID=A0A518H5S9_9BACT|nr:hypothetical protein ElP_40930 [Tautonia plasticadhaerens]
MAVSTAHETIQHRTRDDRAAEADLLAAGIRDRVRRLPRRAAPPPLRSLVEGPGGPADLTAGDLRPAGPLGDGGPLAGRDARPVPLGDGRLRRPLAADAPLQRRGIGVEASGLRHPDGDRPHRGVPRLGLGAVGGALACLGSPVGGGPEGLGPLPLHELVAQDADGLGQAVGAMLGQQFHDLVDGGRLILVGHRRRSPWGRSALSGGTGGDPPLQAEPSPRRAGDFQKPGCTIRHSSEGVSAFLLRTLPPRNLSQNLL